MVQVQKLVISLTLVVLTLVPFIGASQEHAQTDDSHTIKKHTLSPQLSFEIKLHAFLLWASMGFLMPVGILVIRMSNTEECGRRLKVLFCTHATLQILLVLLATAGAVLSIRNFENSFDNYHQRMGLVLYGVIWLQVLLGFIRPQRGSKGRSVWFLVHWGLGTAVSLLGIINVYSGLQAYHKRTSKSIKLWTIIFTAEISVLTFFYLFQGKWNYIKKQGAILGNEPIRPTDQEISPRKIFFFWCIREKKIDSLSETPC